MISVLVLDKKKSEISCPILNPFNIRETVKAGKEKDDKSAKL